MHFLAKLNLLFFNLLVQDSYLLLLHLHGVLQLPVLLCVQVLKVLMIAIELLNALIELIHFFLLEHELLLICFRLVFVLLYFFHEGQILLFHHIHLAKVLLAQPRLVLNVLRRVWTPPSWCPLCSFRPC
jgi:hypothetical protein